MLLRNTTPEIRGASRSLVLVVHAYRSKSANMGGIRDAVRESLPDADFLAPDYPSNVFSDADPVRIAEELVAIVTDAIAARRDRGGDYQEIVFIGHSLGALLVRKAYVFARGVNQDHTGVLAPAPQDWAKLVSRVILLAGVNRGWALRRKKVAMSWAKWVAISVGTLLIRWTGLGRLVNGVREGAPFVANLRIQWITLARSAAPPPLTVQLLGDIDDIVDDYDSIDVAAGADFVYLSVRDTGHANVVDFHGESGRHRREVFLRGLTAPRGELVSERVVPEGTEPDPTVERVVFVMHGIRDSGQWMGDLRKVVEAEGRNRGKKVVVVTSSYGYFPLLRFLIQPERQRNVRWFMDEYTNALARYPNAEFSFIGHSNGTYLLASALERYRACRFDRVVLAGSVVNRHFDWEGAFRRGQVRAVQNYVATADWVVAVFPALFQQLRGAKADLGNAGHAGFTADKGNRSQVCYVRGGHVTAKVPTNFPALAKFALGDDDAQPPANLRAEQRSTTVVLAGKFCVLVWLFLLAIVCLLILSPVLAGVGGWQGVAFSAAVAVVLWQVLQWV